MRRKSRLEKLSRKSENIIIKRIFYLSLFSLIIIVFLFTVGISLIGKLTDFTTFLLKKDENSQTQTYSVPNPPRLDPILHSTNSAKLKISGFSDEGTNIIIYLNDQVAGHTDTVDGKFIIDSLNLKNGDNFISAMAVRGQDNQSEETQKQTIVLDTQEPDLSINSPEEDQSFSKNNRIKVSGQTEKDAQVFVNNFLANVDSEGNFEIYVPVMEGENTIEIKAVDKAGNIKSESRKIHFSN